MRHPSQLKRRKMKRKERAIKENPLENELGKLVKAFGMLEKANFIFQTRFASRSNFASSFFLRLGRDLKVVKNRLFEV